MAELARIETVVVLQTVELLSSCSAEQILRISAIARQSLFPEGEVVYREGDPADAIYFVVRGAISLRTGAGDQSTLGPGGTFGATEILSGRLRSGSASAEEETLVLAIEAEDFFDLLANNIEIVKALFRQLLEKGPLQRPPAHPKGDEK
jgi:CRP-like cAMP-binding protein